MGSETMPSKQDVPREWSVVDHKQLLPNKYIMKWDEGMLKQCYSVGDLYHAWIDHPKLRRVRMFDSDYFEAASFTPWWIVPAIYVPWALLELDLSHQNFLSLPTESDALYSVSVNLLINSLHIPPILLSLFLFFIGVTLWTLFEYFVHKHAFHWTPPSANWNLAHFVGHGLHHLTPADKYRLVFPPAISFPLGLAMRFLFFMLFPFGIRSAVFGGFVCGYAAYESIHYLSHHAPIGSFLQERFKNHSAHHFNPRKQDKLFGVSSQIWDVAFGTY